MTEEEARAWISNNLDVPRGTMEKLERYVALLQSAAETQNLISRSTFDAIWSRHITDSAQLLRFAARHVARWADLGSGAGLPGIVAAILHPGEVVLVEERKLRVAFLQHVCAELDFGPRVRVVGSKVERLAPVTFGVISARAFAPLPKLLALASPFADASTLWLLPKGRNAALELEAVRDAWQGDFRLEPSVTDPDAAIIVATGVAPRRKGKHA